MQVRNRGRRFTVGAFPAALLAVVLLAACGTSSSNSNSGDAKTLLNQTFTGKHTVTSGNLSMILTITPSGSSTVGGPITLSLGGPFQSRGAGKFPVSNFNISVKALGKSGSLGLLSTGTAGYITLQGTSYKLPQATFQKLDSNLGQVTSSSGAGSGNGALGRLGIQPLHWLSNPTIVGQESVGGTDTTHIRAAINVPALLDDLSTFLQKASSIGVSGATRLSGGLPASTKSRIASEVKNPAFDLWTGASDKTMRRLRISLTIPVSGQTSTTLGGLRAAGVGLDIQYANVNQPQTITAPTAVRPFSEFAVKIQSIVQALQSGLGGVTSSGAAAGAGTTSSSSSGSTSAGIQAYSQCIQAAGSDVSKMQRCATLLSGK
jgi:hypothetical protein